jgi:hypothetical protein
VQSDDPRASVAASDALLDRGYGKPVAQIELDHHVNGFDGMTEEELGSILGSKCRSLASRLRNPELKEFNGS